MDLMFATMISKMKKELLKEVFQKLGIVLSEDTLKDFSPRKTESVCEAIKQLTEDEIRKLGHAFERISLVGGSRQNIALISAALLDWNVTITEEMQQYTATNLATWAYLHLPDDDWRDLERRANVNARAKSEWRFFNLNIDADIAPDAVKQHCRQLKTALSKDTVAKEFRGYGCEVSCYAVDEIEYLMVKLTDYPERSDSWDEKQQTFQPSEKPSAFPLVFSFEHDCCRLGVLYEGSASRCDDLATVFSKTVFGGFSRVEPVRYDLSSLKDKSVLPTDKSNGIKSARIVGMELWLDGTRRRRRMYYELDHDIQQVLKNEVPKETLADALTKVKRVHIMITYETRRNPDTKKVFMVSEGAIGGMSDPNHGIGAVFKAYLKNVLKIVVTDDEHNA